MRDEPIIFMDYESSDSTDENGDTILLECKSDVVFAEIKSIGQTEFYQAQTHDNKPEIKFVISDYMDYQGQEYLIHGQVRYSILRTFRKSSNELEITCYGGVRDANTAVSNESN